MNSTIELVEEKLTALSARVDALSQKDFVPWRVWIQFDMERSKSACIAATNVTSLETYSNTTMNNDAIFEGKVLKIVPSKEPSDIIWENSHFTTPQKVISWLISYTGAFTLILAAFFIVRAISNSGSFAVAIFLSAQNAVLPIVVKTLTTMIEIHTERSSVERSMLVKLVIVRCINSGLLIYLAAEYDETFRLQHLESVQNILIFDAFLTPFSKVLDLDGYFMRYVMAMGARTQEEMNVLWQGTEWTLAERYTDLLKTVFVGMFFMVPLPSGLFITAIAMFNVYWTDKYMLFNVWRRPPSLDGSLSGVSRVFFIFSVWTHVSVSRIFFANWPYRVSPLCVYYIMYDTMYTIRCMV